MTTTINHTTFGSRIRTLREKAGLTLKDVSVAVEIDISLLAKIERSERTPTRQQITDVSEFFKVSESDLLAEYLSDLIAYKIINEDVDTSVLKVAEEKVEYLKTIQ